MSMWSARALARIGRSAHCNSPEGEPIFMPMTQFSDKAIKRLTALEDAAFITACYRLLLRRAPDVSGYDNYWELLHNGAAKTDVLATFLNSDEYRTNHAGTTASLSMFVENAGSLDFS